MRAAFSGLAVALLVAGSAAARPAPAVYDGEAVWSPDGRYIAFVRRVRGGAGSGVYVVRVGAHRPTRVRGAGGSSLQWSPATDLLAFLTRDREGAHLALARPDGSIARRFASGGEFSWSRDGATIVYADGDAFGRLDVGTGLATPLEVRTRYVEPRLGSPAWSPDGRRIAFTAGGNRVFVVAAKGGEAREIGLGQTPSWSPAATRLAVSCILGESVRVLDPDSATEGCFIGLTHGWSGRAAWTPDGARLVFAGTFFGYHRVWAATTGGTQHIVTRGFFWSLSPDGQTIAFTRRERGDGTGVLYLARADGTHVRRLLR